MIRISFDKITIHTNEAGKKLLDKAFEEQLERLKSNLPHIDNRQVFVSKPNIIKENKHGKSKSRRSSRR